MPGVMFVTSIGNRRRQGGHRRILALSASAVFFFPTLIIFWNLNFIVLLRFIHRFFVIIDITVIDAFIFMEIIRCPVQDVSDLVLPLLLGTIIFEIVFKRSSCTAAATTTNTNNSAITDSRPVPLGKLLCVIYVINPAGLRISHFLPSLRQRRQLLRCCCHMLSVLPLLVTRMLLLLVSRGGELYLVIIPPIEGVIIHLIGRGRFVVRRWWIVGHDCEVFL
mmetsp:Transcript_6502/g.16126  ORF Transcript_6502/g.16126 Transcript_6502/m.16126 type:complete len:221 (-) Transcript_6502:28-690(-)